MTAVPGASRRSHVAHTANATAKTGPTIVLAVLAGAVLAFSLVATAGAAANYVVYLQKCPISALGICAWAHKTRGMVNAFGWLILPVLALVFSSLAYALMRRTLAHRPAGISLGALFLLWWGIAGLCWFALGRLPVAEGIHAARSGMQWLGLVLGIASLLCAFSLWLQLPEAWMLSLGYLVISLGLVVLNFNGNGISLLWLTGIACKIALLVYLLLPNTRKRLAQA